MKLKVLSKQKAENYNGNSITYEMNTNDNEYRKEILKRLFKSDKLCPQKIKIECLDNEALITDSQYGPSIINIDINKYNNIQFIKYKAYYEGAKISITLDFKDNYLRIKGDYTDKFNDNINEKLAEYIL